MKKFMISCALVFGALAFTACNGEGCYQVTLKWGEQSNTIYVYGESDAVDAAIEKAKAGLIIIGADAKDIKVTRTKVNKSQSDCY